MHEGFRGRLLPVLLLLPGCGDGGTAPATTPVTLAGDLDGDGYTQEGGDCAEGDPHVHPDALEVCNGLDDDCDGAVDEDLGVTWYRDADGDGYGDPATTRVSCRAEPGWVSNAEDCDDAASSAHPGGVEACNGLDDDCDGSVDESGGSTPWYADLDGDGYGDENSVSYPCGVPTDASLDPGDCDDADPTVYPGAPELCDKLDNDCDGVVGDDLDADGDGFRMCDDCDDANPDTWPGAPEACDGEDNDCDGAVPGDEVDADGDGYRICDGDPDDGDPAAIPVLVIEDFESGVWPAPGWVTVLSGGTVDAAYAHDGAFGLRDPDWHYLPTVTFGNPGEVLSAWVRPSGSSGRVYVGFDASPSGCLSFVLAPNTGELIIQDNSGYGYTDVASVPQSYVTGAWYRVEVAFLGSAIVQGRLYAGDGVTLLNSLNASFPSLGLGGMCLRAFDDFDIDTIELTY